MSSFVSRDEWGARAPRPGPGLLDPTEVVGLAVHWPAIASPVHGKRAVKAALRGWQDFHMDVRGWSDIAYQRVIDIDGNRYQGRGLGVQSGANGDEDVNDTYGALLLVLAPGEEPSPAMMRAARSEVRRHRLLFPGSRYIKGHSDIRPEPTACPGPILTRYIRLRLFEPPKPWSPVVLRRRVTRALAEAEEAPDKTPGIDAVRRRLQRTLALLERNTQ